MYTTPIMVFILVLGLIKTKCAWTERLDVCFSIPFSSIEVLFPFSFSDLASYWNLFFYHSCDSYFFYSNHFPRLFFKLIWLRKLLLLSFRIYILRSCAFSELIKPSQVMDSPLSRLWLPHFSNLRSTFEALLHQFAILE